MKRETARREIDSLDFYLQNYTDDYSEESHTAMMMAIDALKSSENLNNVLDKIRAEMFEEMLSHSGTGEEVIQAYADGLKKGLEFIDKYKSESEDKE